MNKRTCHSADLIGAALTSQSNFTEPINHVSGFNLGPSFLVISRPFQPVFPLNTLAHLPESCGKEIILEICEGYWPCFTVINWEARKRKMHRLPKAKKRQLKTWATPVEAAYIIGRLSLETGAANN